jgi:iron complex transport system permease protein
MKNIILHLFIALFLTVVVFTVCLSVGSRFINPMILITGATDDQTALIILNMRFYRLLNAAVVGAALSAAGLAYQAVLRNPLAEPYILGISGGASVGAAVAIAFKLTILNALFLPASAFAGAMIVLFTVMLIAKGAGSEYSTNVILSGVVIGSVCSSILMFLISVMDMHALHNITWWMLGSFQTPDKIMVTVVLIGVIFGIILLFLFGRDANVLSFGEEAAFHFGISPRVSAFILLGTASLLTAAAVSISGIIGFVGLIIPHILRRISGADHRKLFPLSFFAGALFLMICDSFARTVIYPTEIPVGVITASLGGPFFLWLINHKSRKGSRKRRSNSA